MPGSHIRPRHPDNREDFFQSAVQLEGQPGDVVMFAGQIQHCAMTNNTTQVRCGILQQMVLRIIDNRDLCKFTTDNKNVYSFDKGATVRDSV